MRRSDPLASALPSSFLFSLTIVLLQRGWVASSIQSGIHPSTACFSFWLAHQSHPEQNGFASCEACLCCLFCLLLSSARFAPKWIAKTLVPGSHAFLDDYLCLDHVDLRHPKGEIAAYGWPLFGNWPMIAFDDGHIEWVEDNRARLLFRQQGIPYPELKESK